MKVFPNSLFSVVGKRNTQNNNAMKRKETARNGKGEGR